MIIVVFVLIVLLLAALFMIEWLWTRIFDAHIPTIVDGRYEGTNWGVQSAPAKHVCSPGDTLFVNADIREGDLSRICAMRVVQIMESSVVIETTVWNEER
jgi:hypothetical protein